VKIKIHTQIVFAIILGVAAGVIFGERIAGIKILGDIFIRLLKMIIIPLVIASMASGIASIGNIRNLGRIGSKTFLYYMATTLLSVFVGLLLVNIIQPGKGVQLAETTEVAPIAVDSSVIQLITSIVPDNIFKAMAETDVLSVIFFSLLLGVAISVVGEKAKPLADFFDGLNTVMMKITDWVMRLAPIGVFALMAHTIGQVGLAVLKPLAIYMLTVTAGLLIHACVTLPILLSVFAKRSPLAFIRDMFSAVATAFSTASSAATLPITMDCLEKNAKVPKTIAGFVLPLGATINMDGTALYEAVAAMFIAQAYAIDLSIGQQILIMLTATLASIGAAAIPGAGLITLVIVLKAVGLPLEGIGIILAVDRLLDMCRTSVNVWGDACGAAVIAKLEEKAL
jgi:Na+/H+-dicarboxylate symporter